MFFKRLVLEPFETNSYLIKTEDVAMVVDPAVCTDEMIEFLNLSEGEKLILLTHSHFDHIGGAKELRDKTGSQIAVHQLDANGTDDMTLNLSSYFGFPIRSFKADIFLNDGDILSFNNTEIKVIHTPGHTIGSVCYIIENLLISGDTLFEMTIGRTDFPGGNVEEIRRSLNKLSKLDEGLKVCSGHGEITSLGREKRNNPFLKESSNEFM